MHFLHIKICFPFLTDSFMILFSETKDRSRSTLKTSALSSSSASVEAAVAAAVAAAAAETVRCLCAAPFCKLRQGMRECVRICPVCTSGSASIEGSGGGGE